MSEKIQDVTDENFEASVLQAQLPVLVDFWASYCVPCKAIAPVLDELAVELVDQVKIVKVDVGAHHAMAAKYGVRSIPALLLFKDGALVNTKIGSVSKAQLQEFLSSSI